MVEQKKSKMNDIINGVTEILRDLQLRKEDFERKRGKTVHQRVIDKISEEWNKTSGFGRGVKPDLDPVALSIDFVGREYPDGKILLAIEVDTWKRHRHSLLKLADVRAESKIWIYATNDIAAKSHFEKTIGEIRSLLRTRNEDKLSFGCFAAILLTPEDFEMKWVLE